MTEDRKSYSFIGNDCPPGYRRVGTIDVADPADVRRAEDRGYRIGTIYDGRSYSCAEPCAADIYEELDEALESAKAITARAIEIICLEASEMGFTEDTISEFRAGRFDGDDLLTLQAVERALTPSPETKKRAPERPELEELLKAAKAKVDAMSQEELEAMLAAQRESWVRGEMQLDRKPDQSPSPKAEDKHRCPICDEAFKPDDSCATDIELGTCHFDCLDGSPVVDLETCEEILDDDMHSFPYSEVMDPPHRPNLTGTQPQHVLSVTQHPNVESPNGEQRSTELPGQRET